MGRIKKAAGAKHEATLPRGLADFIQAAVKLPIAQLRSKLQELPFHWPFPRGDLYHWIPLLDHFDGILEEFVKEYGFKDGPQTRPFGSALLRRGLSGAEAPITDEQVQQLGYGDEADRELVEAVITFSRLLHENCGNRSLYASSDRLGDILNTTSLSLLFATLRLATRLAIRYHHSYYRGPNNNAYANAALRASHYNIDLDHVQTLSEPLNMGRGVRPETAGGEKILAGDRDKTSTRGRDMLAVVTGTPIEIPENPSFLFPRTPDQEGSAAGEPSDADGPGSPTPARRTSGPSRPTRRSTGDGTPNQSSSKRDESAERSMGTLSLDRNEIKSKPAHEILAENLSKVPKTSHYDLLNYVRAGKALLGSELERQMILAVRILALTNLAYVYPESMFLQKVLHGDSDEPPQLQIVQQLASLVYPPNTDGVEIPVWLKTISLGGLDGFSKQRSRANEVYSILGVTVSHGVLLYILRKTAAELGTEGTETLETHEWNEALVALLDSLTSTPSRIAEALVGAGMLEILVDVLKLRTEKAERWHHRVLGVLSMTVNTVRDAFQAFVNCKGLDAVSDLISWEVSSSIERVENDQGFPATYKSHVTDYRLPYFQQQTLRWLFKFVNHMMTNNNAHFDRVLRNLIESPSLLNGLRDVLANGDIFGSTIWSGAVNILSSFIHNEPTSYAVIAEAGLSKTLLESVLKHPFREDEESAEVDPSWSITFTGTEAADEVRKTVRSGAMENYKIERVETVKISRADGVALAHGILPATDAINAIPSAFGAICLNNSGLDMFLKSGALETFFEVFESPEHVRSLSAESNLPKVLGQHFDELVRHHPRLKSAVTQAIVLMVARVGHLCNARERHEKSGARLLSVDTPAISPDGSSTTSEAATPQATANSDVEMRDTAAGEGGKSKDSDEPHTTTYLKIMARFLAGFFDNQSLCGNFLHSGGLEFLLDITTSPCLPYNFSNVWESHDLCHVFRLLIDYKPHLVLPAIMTRLISSLKLLEPLMQHRSPKAFFATFTQGPSAVALPDSSAETPPGQIGFTEMLKAMVSVHLLLNVLHDAFLTSPYGSRSGHSLFNQVNLTDSYLAVVDYLGRLYRVCVWEEIQLQNNLSEDLKEKTRVNGYGMGSDEADEIFGFRQGTNAEANPPPSILDNPEASAQDDLATNEGTSSEASDKSHLNRVLRLNIISLRYLLSQLPSSITPFLQGLGRSLVPKRRLESYQRQNAYMVADALGEVALANLRYDVACESTNAKDRFAYWIVAITSLSHLLIEGVDGRGSQVSCVTLVLHAFRSHGGLEFTNELVREFSKPLTELQGSEKLAQEQQGLLTCVGGGLKLLLMFYGSITTHKIVVETPQSHTLSNTERDPNSPYYFAPNWLLADVRLSVLSAVRPIWESGIVERAGSPTIRNLIDILKNTLQPDSSPPPPTNGKGASKASVEFKPFSVSSDKEASLKARNVPADLAREALYRCANGREFADEYCDAQIRGVTIPRIPIPDYETNERQIATSSARAARRGSEDTIPDADKPTQSETTGDGGALSDEASSSARQAGPDQQTVSSDSDVGDGMAMSIDNLLNLHETPGASMETEASSARQVQPIPMPHRIPRWQPFDRTSLQKFEELRTDMRNSLVEKILDILSSHNDVTFELAELVLMATSNDTSVATIRNEMGLTLVQSLISMTADDIEPNGTKIASLANLVAIVMQDKDWFTSIKANLTDSFSALIGFVRVGKTGASCPWVSPILALLEKLLSEDEQPVQINWRTPTTDAPESDQPAEEIEGLLVSQEDKSELFKHVLEILPKVAKDQALALSVARIMAILTRDRDIATQLAEKRNIQRLFLMLKQLAGSVSERLQNTFMLVLRHMMEDDETIRNIVRSEIVQNFRGRARPIDTHAYIRSMHAHMLRSPRIFLEVTNEMLKLQRFDFSSRQQVLVLKETASSETPDKASDGPQTTPTVADPGQVTEEASAVSDAVQPTGVNADDELKLKRTTTDPKFPTLEYSDGVVHYILSELLAYKDLEDREPEPSMESKDEAAAHSTTMDVDPAPNPAVATQPKQDSVRQNEQGKKSDHGETKPEHHPFYFYRCFLLQCLAELLMSYSRAKIAFINFSRKADSKANTTPSKPRSVVLNYILNSLIPINRLDKAETAIFKKSAGTSNWAMSVVVALCLKTSEKVHITKPDNPDDEPDPDLTFVRKFVLEQALKAFRDSQNSSEALPTRYGKLLTLADLFARLLNGRVLPTLPGYSPESSGHTINQMAKIMFEKGFIAALTNSVSDVDLNVENAKRVVKYVLRPLKTLTQMAIYLSQNSDLSTSSAQTDEDEISTATSMSEEDEGREETPDLFRHSVLGTLDSRRDEESSSESDDEQDEDMYDDYDDGTEYDEDIQHDGDEVMSDDEDDIGNQGHVEGLPGDVGVAFEVVMSDGGEVTEGDTEEEDDSEDDDEDMDEDQDVEIIEEMTADDENDSLEDQENDWEDDDGDSGTPFAFDAMENVGSNPNGTGNPSIPIHMDIMEADDEEGIPSDPASVGNLTLDVDFGHPELTMAMGPDDEDDEEDEPIDEEDPDDIEDEEEEILYPDYDDEDGQYEDSPWGWDPEEQGGGRLRHPMQAARRAFEHPTLRHHHHHHHDHLQVHRIDPWSIFSQHHPGSDRLAPYRTHRGGVQSRNPDDNVNPLLQRSVSPDQSTRRGPTAMTRMQGGLRDVVRISSGHNESPISLISNMMQAVGAVADQGINISHGALHLHVGGPGGGSLIPFPREIQTLMGSRPTADHGRTTREEPFYLPVFFPTPTATRWAEEARLLFSMMVQQKTLRILNSMMKMLVPPAIEEEKIRKAKEAEQLEIKREEERVKAEREAKEKAEREEKERQEREEREAREIAEREAAEREAAEQQAQETTEQGDPNAMEGIERTQIIESTNIPDGAADAGTTEPAVESEERVRATFRGREVDITHLGIDLEYLNALPEELREEVLMQQLAEQRSQQASSGEQPTEIDREFLEALPPNIREEILAQEAQDRRRRERDEARRQQNANAGAPSARAEDMDTASFLASLDPVLRHAVLLEQDEDMINQLPAAIAAEARAIGAERGPGMQRWSDMTRPPRRDETPHHRTAEQAEQSQKKIPKRQIVQMLDKAGVATLLRILFVSTQGSALETLNDVLQNVSENRQTRTEILGIILSVLQDGTADAAAVEKSFTQLSVRAKQQGISKTPQPLKRTPTGPISMPPDVEMTPLAVIQHCLNALRHLTESNPHTPTFFLTEHENTSSLKSKGARKGKSKDSQEAKYPLNALLNLLDRRIVMDSTVCLERLSSLLQSITQPLMVLRHQKDESLADDETKKAEDDAKKAEESNPGTESAPVPVATEVPADSAATSTEEPSVAAESSIKENDSEPKDATPAEGSKKQRKYTPPQIPEQNLRLVVNIVSARECSGKTFRDTLSTINNLSVIPGAKEVFGRELVNQSRALAEAIVFDLDLLMRQVQQTDTNNEIHGIALSKFSPSSSDQAKLLRVLTALDYIFDPKRSQIKRGDEKGSGPDKDSMLATLYESPKFGLLWNKLGDCLKEIRQRDSKTATAAILLPLIEALMVVCKNTALKEGSSIATKEFQVTSPVPDTSMESLFFRFTEEHRKVLNDLVRQNPRLMSGTFSLLVKNPKVLEFDNKRNYFSRKLHSRSDMRRPQPPLQLSVRREQTFVDSYRTLYFKSAEEIKYGKLSIRFHGEEGVDAGGVTREWFQTMSRQMFNPDYALFTPVASDRTTFHPNKDSYYNDDHLAYFKFIGRIIGKALYEGRALDCHFSRAVYKRILGRSVSLKDMETLDLDYYRSLVWMLENDISDIITETFSVHTDVFGASEVVDLVENGSNIPVTEENKQEYVQLVVEYRLTGSVKLQLDEFLRGFHDIVPAELISIFNEQELELLISGLPDIDVDDWKNHTDYHNYSASSAQIQWFWRAVRSFDKEERAKLLQFVTGTAKVPLNGFKELEGMNGFSRFNIHRDYGNKQRLPSSHTCFNQLDLPEYDDYETLRQQVYMAMTAGSQYFGFA